MISVQRIRELLDYEPDTGVLRWKNRGRYTDGRAAGSPLGDGYIGVRIDGRTYLHHRIAYLHFHGDLPAAIDHINGFRADNRISNLRPAPKGENSRNMGKSAANKSGFTGVFWIKSRKRWAARITVNGKLHSLGYYIDKEDAVEARARAQKERGFSDRHGTAPSWASKMEMSSS